MARLFWIVLLLKCGTGIGKAVPVIMLLGLKEYKGRAAEDMFCSPV
jgi:hypothetical protein